MNASAPFDTVGFLSALRRRGCGLGEPFHYFTVTSSTNDEALSAARAGAPHGAVYLAEEQTQGRGRRGRQWFAPAGRTLLFSVLLRPRLNVQALAPLTLTAGLAVREALSVLCGIEPTIKWPNDIEWQQRKLAGILVQAELSAPRPAVVVGVGLNVRQFEVPAALDATPTSIEQCAPTCPGREALLVELLACLDAWFQRYVAQGFSALQPELARRDGLQGCAVEVGSLRGIARGIDSNGHLRVETASGVVAVRAGTVRRG